MSRVTSQIHGPAGDATPDELRRALFRLSLRRTLMTFAAAAATLGALLAVLAALGRH